MAEEIRKEDIISEEAIKAPLELAKNIRTAIEALDEFLAKQKQSGAAIPQSSSPSRTKKDTEELTGAEKELEKIAKQIATAEDKNNSIYRAKQKILADLKKDMKEKVALDGEDATKITSLTASYTKLSAALSKNKDAYKNLTSEEARNSVEGKKLLKVIQQQDAEVKKLSSAMGEEQRNVGNYTKSIVEAGGGLQLFGGRIGQVTGIIKSMGKEMATLITNPWFLGMTAIILAVGALTSAVKTFFSTTGEGEDVLGKQTLIWDAFFDNIKAQWAQVGKSIVDGLGGAEKASSTLLAGLSGVIAVVAPFLIPLFEKLRKEFEETSNEIGPLYDKIDKLGDEMVANLITRSVKERDANKLIEESKDKLIYTDEQRLKLLKEAVGLQDQVSKTEISNETKVLDLDREGLANKRKDIDFLKDGFKLTGQNVALGKANIEVLRDQIKESDLIDEQKKALSEQIVKIINLEAQYYQQQRKNRGLISALELEIAKTQRDAANRLFDAKQAQSAALYKNAADANLKILTDDKSTNQQRLAALVELQKSRIGVVELSTGQELEQLKRAAEDRIRQEGQNDQAVIDARLASDKAYQMQREIVVDKGNQAIKNIYETTANDLVAAQSLSVRSATTALNESFAAGKVSLKDYLSERRKLTEGESDKLLQDQIDFYKSSLDVLTENEAEKDAVLKKIYELREKLAAGQAARELAIQQQVEQAKRKLMNDTLTLFETIGDARYDKQIQQVDREIDVLKRSYDEQIGLAGDNEKEKARLEAEFAHKEEQLNERKRQIQHDQAVFEKAIAVSRAIVNTAVAVTANLEFPILAGLIAALGAVEIATIIAQPIPAAEHGVDNFRGGLIRVSEAGPELVIFPGGKRAMTPENESFVNLPAGSTVIPHDETVRRLAIEGMDSRNTLGTSDDAAGQAVYREIKGLRADMQASRSPKVNLFRQGATVFEAMEDRNNNVRIVKAINLGSKWVK